MKTFDRQNNKNDWLCRTKCDYIFTSMELNEWNQLYFTSDYTASQLPDKPEKVDHYFSYSNLRWGRNKRRNKTNKPERPLNMGQLHLRKCDHYYVQRTKGLWLTLTKCNMAQSVIFSCGSAPLMFLKCSGTFSWEPGISYSTAIII